MNPANEAAPQVQRLVLHPACLAVFFSVTFFFFFLYSENRYSAQTLTSQFLLSYGWGVVYLSGFYVFMGRPIHFLISRNVPMVWAYFGFFLIVAIAEATFGLIFFSQDLPFRQFFWHIISTQFAIIPAIVICGLYFEKDLRRILSKDPTKLPYWQPVKTIIYSHQASLPEELHDTVLRLEAHNQYVEVVTERGSSDIRMTLSAAVDLLPQGEGIRIHRSIWLNKSEISALRYVDGNPGVVTPDGTRFPLSRNKVAEIKKVIASLENLEGVDDAK